uniref:SH2 domain-containing protein n=1 Tax=Pelusios castaneus TaxID=367368 RepID=A0A8C8R6N1_9SAUR
MDFPFYHGNITRKTCEELLSKKSRNGSYLLRDSESVAGAYCLCVFFENFIYTYRIFRECDGYYRIQTSEDVPKRIFKTVKDLIYAYEKPNQGLITNLCYPKPPAALAFHGRGPKTGPEALLGTPAPHCQRQRAGQKHSPANPPPTARAPADLPAHRNATPNPGPHHVFCRAGGRHSF